MQNLFKTSLLSYFLLVLLSCVCVNAIAQKLPNVQENGVYAPGNLKIDGKATEWSDQFKAYNHSTDIFYTVSNDDLNLYLVVKATNPNIIDKILDRGISFNIQQGMKAKTEKVVTIIYPIFQKNTRPAISLKRKGEILPLPELAAQVADSIMRANNKRFSNSSKFIQVMGVEGIDSLISIYNEEGIKAVGLFDKTKSYTCELAIPTKYLGLGNAPVKFAYHVIINSATSLSNKKPPIQIAPGEGSGTNADGTPMSQASVDAFIQRINGIRASLDAPTDFWGEYTFVKK